MPPAAVSRFWVYLPIVILLLSFGFIAVLMRGLVTGSRSSSFELTAEGLRLKGDIYGRMIPFSQIVRSGVMRVDVTRGPFKPAIKTVGTALPSYRAGWWRLVNGHKALLYMSDRS